MAEPSFLVINVSRIGDTLLATPAIRAIAQAHPGARITVLGQREEALAVLKPLPMIHAVTTFNGAIEAEYEGDDTTAAAILQTLTAGGIKVSGFNQLEGGLEDAFMRATEDAP